MDDSAQENDDMDQDDEATGDEDVQMDVQTLAVSIGPVPTGPKFHKTPMGEELKAMKDASELFQSSSFKLQVRLSLARVLVFKNSHSICL